MAFFNIFTMIFLLLIADVSAQTTCVTNPSPPADDICGVKGYDEGTGELYITELDNAEFLTIAGCSAACSSYRGTTIPRCLSFFLQQGTGGWCLLYGGNATQIGFGPDSFPPYAFWDLPCFICANTSSTSSSFLPTSSSAQATSSSSLSSSQISTTLNSGTSLVDFFILLSHSRRLWCSNVFQ